MHTDRPTHAQKKLGQGLQVINHTCRSWNS